MKLRKIEKCKVNINRVLLKTHGSPLKNLIQTFGKKIEELFIHMQSHVCNTSSNESVNSKGNNNNNIFLITKRPKGKEKEEFEKKIITIEKHAIGISNDIIY